jgi:glycosyltransferase involved in cell wall biosynthesis
MSDAPDLSIVVPAFNEVESLPALVERTIAAVTALGGRTWELILVDDGSTDGTTALVRRLASEVPGVKAVVLRTNFGKSAALMAGFEESRGEIVITMDADLQDDPAEIPAFIAEIESGFDLVSGWKRDRQDPLEKRIASRIFNAVVRKASGLALHDSNCGFKAYRRWCVQAVQIRGNQHRYIPAILSWCGAKIAEIPVRHHPRTTGKSKYGMSRYLHGAIDLATLVLLTKFSQKPLYLFAMIGLPVLALGGLIGAWLLVNHLLYLSFGTVGFPLTIRPLLIIAVFLFLMGLLIFLIGLIAELVLRASTGGKGYWVGDVVSARGEASRGAGRAMRTGEGGAGDGHAGDAGSTPDSAPGTRRTPAATT